MNTNPQISKTKPDAAQIREARSRNPEMRERDFARTLGITEADLAASFCGHGTRRIEARFEELFPGLEAVGEVMALTRNESAVIEKIGPFDKYVKGKRASLMLGKLIDMRMFPGHWVHGFAVEKSDGETVRRSLQFFDAHGEAVHKIHARPDTNIGAWNQLVEQLLSDDQSPELSPVTTPAEPFARKQAQAGIEQQLKDRWEAMTDPHQFVGLLNDLDLDRVSAFERVGSTWAWPLDNGSVQAMLRLAASENVPIMCFVGNRGCIEIHSGAIENVADRGPWINVMDPTFHLHLRTDHIHEVWAVRKPADVGHVTSIEAYNSEGEQIIQFFGVRGEGRVERNDWRDLVENLPRLPQSAVLGAAE